MSDKKRVYKIRKLTPRECFRLMNYTDTDFDRAASVNSNSQLYKQTYRAYITELKYFVKKLENHSRKVQEGGEGNGRKL